MLDASFALQWLFRDEASPEGDAALSAVAHDGAVVQALRFSEITNALGMAERRGRIDPAGTQHALHLLGQLTIVIDDLPSLTWADSVLHLMRAHRLTAYDAAYLELARRRGLPLATKDRDLRAAAAASNIPMFAPPAPSRA